MAYSQCVLDGYTYPVNPRQNVNPPVKNVVTTDGLSGRFFTDWGYAASRRDIVQSWPVLDAAQYQTLAAKVKIMGGLSFVDTDSTAYTVIAESITHSGANPQEDCFMDVRLTLKIVSQP